MQSLKKWKKPVATSEDTYVPGNIINFEQKKREFAEQHIADQEESNDAPEVVTLICPCGCSNITAYRDSEWVSVECSMCGMPMLNQLLTFMRGKGDNDRA